MNSWNTQRFAITVLAGLTVMVLWESVVNPQVVQPPPAAPSTPEGGGWFDWLNF